MLNGSQKWLVSQMTDKVNLIQSMLLQLYLRVLPVIYILCRVLLDTQLTVEKLIMRLTEETKLEFLVMFGGCFAGDDAADETEPLIYA